MGKRYPATILATAVIPWDDQYRFMEGLFREQVRTIRDGLTPRIYIFGTAGEGYAVSDRQFDEIVRVFCEETLPHGSQPMVGLISLSTRTVVERIERCAELGVRDFQISLPSWGALTDREVDNFFGETCGRFPECRFLHYNLPRAKRVLRGVDYTRLSAEHLNLVAAKVGGGDDPAKLVDMLTKAPDLQFFLGEPGFAAIRDRYECGYLISLGLVDFTRAREFFAARGSELATMRQELGQVLQAAEAAVGDRGHMDGAYDKLFIKLHLPEFPLRLLPPYTATDEAGFATFLENLPAKWRGDRSGPRLGERWA